MTVLARPVPAAGQHSALDTASQEIVGLRAEFKKTLGGAIGIERFERAVLTAIQRDPELLNHPRDSLVSAGLKAAQDRLLPDGREGAFVVRWNSKSRRKEVTWAPMVYGIVKIAKQYAGVRSLSCEIVYQGEPFRILLGDEMRIEHERIPTRVVQGKEVGSYAIFCLSDGERVREFMTAEEIRQVEESSESARKGVGPWKAWRGEMMRKSVIRRLSKRVPALDEGGEALRRVIERVDEDYSFGRPVLEVAADQDRSKSGAISAVGPTALVGASAFGLEALDCALADLASADDLRGYLADAGLRTWLARLRRNHPEQAEHADMLIAAAWARIDPDSLDEEPAPPWDGMAWPIMARSGHAQDMGDADQWEAEFERRIVVVERRADLTAEDRRRVIQAIADANRGILAELRERGHGSAVETVEGLFAEALGHEGVPA